MKTHLNFKVITVAMIIATVMTSINAEAQSRRYTQNNKQDNNKEQTYNSKKNQKSKKNRENTTYDSDQKGNKTYSYRNNNSNEYNHPQYGHVYRKFSTNPIKLKHSNGYVYFYDGNYYRYRRGIGYIKISTPRNLVFTNLPSKMKLVRIGINTYYKYGNLLFERHNNGYRLASNINLQININL